MQTNINKDNSELSNNFNPEIEYQQELEYQQEIEDPDIDLKIPLTACLNSKKAAIVAHILLSLKGTYSKKSKENKQLKIKKGIEYSSKILSKTSRLYINKLFYNYTFDSNIILKIWPYFGKNVKKQLFMLRQILDIIDKIDEKEYCYEHLSQNPYLTEEFILNNLNKLDFKFIQIPVKTIKQYKLLELLESKNINNNKVLDLTVVVHRPDIEQILQKYNIDDRNTYWLPYNQNCNIEFIIKDIIDKPSKDLDMLLNNKSFIKKLQESNNEEFVINFMLKNKISRSLGILRNTFISSEYYAKNLDFIFNNICKEGDNVYFNHRNNCIDQALLNKNIAKYNDGELLYKIAKMCPYKFAHVSDNKGLTENFIINNEQNLDWLKLSKNKALTINLIRKYKEKLHIKQLSSNPNIVEHFTEQDYEDFGIYADELCGIKFS